MEKKESVLIIVHEVRDGEHHDIVHTNDSREADRISDYAKKNKLNVTIVEVK